MPVTVAKRGDKYRVVEIGTGNVAKNKGGTALNGGGHDTREAAEKQVSAVNISQARKRGHKIPPSRGQAKRAKLLQGRIIRKA